MTVAPPGSSKPQLVLAPGMLCDAGEWTEQAEAFSGRFEVLVPDYGPARSMTDMASAVLDQAAPRFSLAGHSMGGRVALEVVRLAPDRVERLCLLATEHRPAPEGEGGRREAEGRRKLRDLALSQGMGAVAESWMPLLIPDRRRGDAALVAAITSMIGRQTPEQLEAQVEAGETRPDSTAVLTGLSCPLLVMGGEDDSIRPPVAQQAMIALAPSGRLVVLADCGHMLTMERPDEVVREMTAWLAQPISC